MRLDRDEPGKHGRAEKRRAPQAPSDGKRSHFMPPPDGRIMRGLAFAF
jgi:hypothetical protein